MSFQQRIVQKIETVKQLMQKDGLDGLVITNSIDQFYLLNFLLFLQLELMENLCIIHYIIKILCF